MQNIIYNIRCQTHTYSPITHAHLELLHVLHCLQYHQWQSDLQDGTPHMLIAIQQFHWNKKSIEVLTQCLHVGRKAKRHVAPWYSQPQFNSSSHQWSVVVASTIQHKCCTSSTAQHIHNSSAALGWANVHPMASFVPTAPLSTQQSLPHRLPCALKVGTCPEALGWRRILQELALLFQDCLRVQEGFFTVYGKAVSRTSPDHKLWRLGLELPNSTVNRFAALQAATIGRSASGSLSSSQATHQASHP